MPRGCELYTIDTTILRNRPKSTKKTTPLLPLRLCPPFFLLRGNPSSAKLVLGRRLGEGAPFVARRAMNLHGCVPASLCPPFFLLRGVPQGANFVREWGAPSPAASPPV